MLKELVKIANRLDSLGLSKEADILDTWIEKMAEEAGVGGMSKDDPYQAMLRRQKLQEVTQKAQTQKWDTREMDLAEQISKDVLLTIPSHLRTSEATFKDMFMRSWSTKPPVRTGILPQVWKDTGSDMAKKMWDKYGQSVETGPEKTSPKPSGMHAQPATSAWDKYVAATPNGGAVKAAWMEYSSSKGTAPSFSKFVEWYNSNAKAKGRAIQPSEVVEMLKGVSAGRKALTEHVVA